MFNNYFLFVWQVPRLPQPSSYCHVMLSLPQLANSDKVSYAAVELFVNLSERSRLFTEKYFNVTKPLYFDFTHLVCRSAIDGE